MINRNTPYTEEEKKEAEELIKQRDEKLIPIVKDIFQKLAAVEIPSSLSTKEEFDSVYEPVQLAILKVLRENDCTMMDYDYITSRMNGIMVYVFDNLVKTSLEMAFRTLNLKVFGKTQDELGFDEIDKLIKK